MAWIKAKGEMAPAWNSQENEKFVKGAVLHGVITGSKNVATQYGERKLFFIEEEKTHKSWGVWLTAQLESVMGNFPIGTELKITYLGKEKTPKGQYAHRFDVEYDEETMKKSPEDEIFA